MKVYPFSVCGLVVVALALSGALPPPILNAQRLRPGGNVIIGSKPSITGTALARATQYKVLRVERNVFRKGGWGFRYANPSPYGTADARVSLRVDDVVPAGSTITAATLSWSFTGFSATTGASRPTPGFELPYPAARAPRVHGSGNYCISNCTPATINRWSPDAGYSANRIELDGQAAYAIPGSPTGPSGAINVLSVYSASSLSGHTLTFVGRVRYDAGRPFFGTEGWNADTEFDVNGYAQVTASATLTVAYSLPTYAISGNTQVPGVTVTAGGRTAISDEGGNYSIPSLPSGLYTVLASKPDCAVSPSMRSVSIGPSAIDVNFETSCATPTWQISTVGMPAGTYINSGWARSRDDAFVFGTTSPQGQPAEAHLYRWNGQDWTEVLFLPNAYASSVFGTGTSEVWVSAFYAPSGPSVVYRSTDDGLSWTLQQLPPEINNAWVGSLTGTPTNLHASAGGNTIIRFDGTNWTAIGAGGTTNNDPPGPMTMLSATEGYYTTCWGWGSWDGAKWTFHSNGFDFCDVGSIFATHDSSNDLVLYTAGNNNFSNGVRVWAYNGHNFGSKCGYVFGDPVNGNFNCNGVLAGNGSYAYATGIYGSAPNDLYVTGKLGYPTGEGRLYRFDGTTWTNITDTLSTVIGGSLPVTTTIFGTAADDIWIPLADGRVLHYTR